MRTCMDTVGLARYVTTIANSGTCYNLTLVDKIENHNSGTVTVHEAEIRNRIDMDQAYWNAIHAGMRGVVEGKRYFADLDVNVAGKTGTAQGTETGRTMHCLSVMHLMRRLRYP